MREILTKHEAADKTKSASKDFPYIPCIADSFFYCCLPSPITSTEVRHLILPVKPLSCAVMWLAISLADFSFGVCINGNSGISAAATFFVILSIFYSWFTLSKASLCLSGRSQMWDSSSCLMDVFSLILFETIEQFLEKKF